MDSSWRRLFSVIRTCRKTIRRGLKGIRRRAYSIGTYLKLKRTRARDDEELESAEIFDDSQQEAIVCNEPFGMSMTKMNYDCTTVETVAEEQLVKVYVLRYPYVYIKNVDIPERIGIRNRAISLNH